jgi:hypothetical protein
MQANNLSRFQKNSKTLITILFDTYISRHFRNNLKKEDKNKNKNVRKLPKMKKWITILENAKCNFFVTTPSPTKTNKQKTNNKKPTHIRKTTKLKKIQR